MKFINQKRIQVEKQDKSDKGELDKPILILIKKINSQRNYYTTSSCSGRIVLIKGKEKKQRGLFLFRTHEKISFAELKKEIKDAACSYKGVVYLKQEYCILHVACSSLDKAQEMLDKAKLTGWKKSGIIASKKRFVVELSSTEKIELPVINKGKILISDELLRLIVEEANRKLERGWEKIKKLERMI